jgi:hypothetical protein
VEGADPVVLFDKRQSRRFEMNAGCRINLSLSPVKASKLSAIQADVFLLDSDEAVHYEFLCKSAGMDPRPNREPRILRHDTVCGPHSTGRCKPNGLAAWELASEGLRSFLFLVFLPCSDHDAADARASSEETHFTNYTGTSSLQQTAV